jgi:hypothetical protein
MIPGPLVRSTRRLLENTSEPVRVEPFDFAQDRLREAESKHRPQVDQWLARFDSVAHATEFILSGVEGLSANGVFQQPVSGLVDIC